MQYLRFKGYFILRLNSGAIRTVKNDLIRLAPAGTPDILAIKQGGCTFIEVKRNKKLKPTALQLAKMDELRGYGARCLVASSVEDLEKEGI